MAALLTGALSLGSSMLILVRPLELFKRTSVPPPRYAIAYSESFWGGPNGPCEMEESVAARDVVYQQSACASPRVNAE
jgi:hypothetical protein